MGGLTPQFPCLVLVLVQVVAAILALMFVFLFVSHGNPREAASYDLAELSLMALAVLAVFVALPIMFSPAYKYSVVTVLVCLFVIVTLAVKAKEFHVAALALLFVLLLYLVDPFFGNAFAVMASGRTEAGAVDSSTSGGLASVGRLWPDYLVCLVSVGAGARVSLRQGTRGYVRHQSPTANRQPPPTANRQPPSTANRQLPTITPCQFIQQQDNFVQAIPWGPESTNAPPPQHAKQRECPPARMRPPEGACVCVEVLFYAGAGTHWVVSDGRSFLLFGPPCQRQERRTRSPDAPRSATIASRTRTSPFAGRHGFAAICAICRFVVDPQRRPGPPCDHVTMHPSPLGRNNSWYFGGGVQTPRPPPESSGWSRGLSFSFPCGTVGHCAFPLTPHLCCPSPHPVQ